MMGARCAAVAALLCPLQLALARGSGAREIFPVSGAKPLAHGVPVPRLLKIPTARGRETSKVEYKSSRALAFACPGGVGNKLASASTSALAQGVSTVLQALRHKAEEDEKWTRRWIKTLGVLEK
jgi:hypothetical protein